VKTEDFWPVTWVLREKIKKTFDENGVDIPYNRLEVDVLQNPKEFHQNLNESNG
jgi:small conductance mechanosensitive channel